MARKRYINLYVPEELVSKIDEMAAREDRSRNYIIRRILEDSLLKKE